MKPVEKIQEILDNKNIKASKMMKDLGFSSGLFSQWKAGKQQVSLEKIVSIANYFDCSIDYLLGRTDNPNTDTRNISNSNIVNVNGNNGDHSPLTAMQSGEIDKTTMDFLRIFLSLPIEKRIDVMHYAICKTKDEIS